MNTDVAAALQAPVLSAHGVVMLVFAAVVFAVLIWDRLSIATVCLGVLGLLPLAFAAWPMDTAQGPVDPLRFFSGFGHPALIAICALMVLGNALVVTGALEPLARLLASWVGAAPMLAPLAVLGAAGAASTLVNDTPVVVLFIPLVIAVAQRAQVSAGGMLLPMNYAVLIGGMATTIGTSTNLIVVAIAGGLGVGPIGIFSFASLVGAAAVPAMLYLWLVAPRLLSHVQPPSEKLSAEVFETELEVEADSWLDGRALHEAFKATGHRMQLIEVRRGSRTLTRLPGLKFRAGDRLLIQDTAESLKDIETSLRAKLHGTDLEAPPPQAAASADEPSAPLPAVVAQMIVTPQSPLVGRTVRQERIAERYGVAVVGVRARVGAQLWQRDRPSERTLAAGDILLMQGAQAAVREAQHDGIGLLLDAQFTLPRQHKAALALAVMGAVVLLAATRILPISLAAVLGVLVLLAARCLSWQEVAQSLSTKVVLLVAASLALGDALALTGGSAWLAGQLAVHTQGLSAGWVLALLMLLMGVLTNFVSNNAAAAIGTPLGIALAQSLGVAPPPFVLAVLFGCNLCYVTPMGYQTNLLVMNAGGYKFGDFVRVGTPLFLMMWVALSWGLVQRYSL